MNTDTASKVEPDYNLIKPLAIPDHSKIPDKLSTSTEYDLYFRLIRSSPDLIQWSETCLGLYENQAKDLDGTNLDDQEKYQIVKGWLVVFQITLEKWLKMSQISAKG